MKINIISNFIVNIDLCVERMYCLLCVKIIGNVGNKQRGVDVEEIRCINVLKNKEKYL